MLIVLLYFPTYLLAHTHTTHTNAHPDLLTYLLLTRVNIIQLRGGQWPASATARAASPCLGMGGERGNDGFSLWGLG